MYRLICGGLFLLIFAQAKASHSEFKAVIDLHDEQDWSLITKMDLSAIYQTLKLDHPAALLQVDDLDFIKQLKEGYQQAFVQAQQVDNYDEYRAVLNTYTARFDDLHIATKPTTLMSKTWWPGFVIHLQDGRWVVTDTAESLGGWSTQLPQKGMELLSCDDVSVAQWAQRTLGTYMANWAVEAQRARVSPWLFLGEMGIEQFEPRPRQCVFAYQLEQVSLPVVWQQTATMRLHELVMSQSVGKVAGFGISKFKNGYWISFGALGGEVDELVFEIERFQQYIRQAEFVVLDVRGNYGGDSHYANRIAMALYGDDYARAAIAQPFGDLPNQHAYRVSKANLRQLEDYLTQAKLSYAEDDPYVVYLQSMRDQVKAAMALGLELAPAVSMDVRAMGRTPMGDNSGSLFKGQVLLLTDNGCFSSCLLLTDLFLRLGAMQVGRTTNMMSRYYDTKMSYLPSGLSTFVTLTKVDFGAPKHLGPFKPRYTYGGDMSNTQKLKSWVLDLLAADRD